MPEPTDLESALAELRAERAARQAAEAARAASDAAFSAQVAELTGAVLRLTEQVAKLLGRKPKKPPPEVKPAPTEDNAAESLPSPTDADPALIGRPKPPEIPAKPEKAKGPVRPSGRKPVPDHLVTDSASHRPSRCGKCGGEDLRIVGEEITHQLDTIREHLRRSEIVRKRCLCSSPTCRRCPGTSPSSLRTCSPTSPTRRWVCTSRSTGCAATSSCAASSSRSRRS